MKRTALKEKSGMIISKKMNEGEATGRSVKIDGSRPSHISKRLTECYEEKWFKILFINLFISSLVRSNQKGTLTSNMVMTRIHNARKLNWCKFVKDAISETTSEWSKNKKGFFVGPIIVLVVSIIELKKKIFNKN